MARRLTLAQWHSIRAAWESSPKTGYSWLTAESGGPWAISREAVRQRAQQECWQKIPGISQAINQDDEPVISKRAGHDNFDGDIDEKKSDQGLTLQGENERKSVAFADLNNDQRLELRDRHRREWNSIARGLIYDLAREARIASGVDKARIVKVVVECLRSLQQAEAVAHGLAVLDIDWDNLTPEQLKAIYEKGKLPT